MLRILEAAVTAAGFADPKDKDPSVKILDGRMFLVAGKVTCVFTEDVEQNLAATVALKLLRNAVKTKDNPVITGRNTGYDPEPVRIKSGRSSVKVPSKSTDEYPFSEQHHQVLQDRFQNSTAIPGSLIHSALTQAEGGLEPAQPELPYSQVVWLTISEGSVLCVSGGIERVIKTPVYRYQELEGINVSLNIPRVYIPILDYFVQKDFGYYNLFIDDLENPSYLKASFPGVNIYMELYIPVDDAMQARLSFIASIMEAWDEIVASGQFISVPKGFRESLGYAASLVGDQLVLSVNESELCIQQPKSVPTEVDTRLPFVHPEVLPFILQARKASSTPGEYIFFYEEVDEDGHSLGVRRLMFASSDVCDEALLHFLMVNPLV